MVVNARYSGGYLHRAFKAAGGVPQTKQEISERSFFLYRFINPRIALQHQ
jgi:hypothetical protein